MKGKEENEAKEGERLITAQVILSLSLLSAKLKHTMHSKSVYVTFQQERKRKHE
jgi:hypothetical protein